MAAALPAIGSAVATYGPTVASGVYTAYKHLPEVIDIAKKYAPTVKKLANHVFSKNKLSSALKYMKNIPTKQGVKNLISDVPKALKGASKFISSGKALKAVKGVAGDVKQIGNIVSEISPELGGKISDLADVGEQNITHYHEQLENFNKGANTLYNNIKDSSK